MKNSNSQRNTNQSSNNHETHGSNATSGGKQYQVKEKPTTASTVAGDTHKEPSHPPTEKPHGTKQTGNHTHYKKGYKHY